VFQTFAQNDILFTHIAKGFLYDAKIGLPHTTESAELKKVKSKGHLTGGFTMCLGKIGIFVRNYIM
jgi:hypothetical protein